jgi:RNA polymerase sigma factor (TIGR02999 family)
VPAPEDVTLLLHAWQEGDAAAGDRLAMLVQAELRGIAGRRLRAERDGHTLQPTALVNEAWVRLIGQHNVVWQNRLQFFAVAAVAMRRILVDHARKRNAGRRGSNVLHVPVDEELPSPLPDARLIALDDALQRLAVLDARHARVVELRYFGGLSVEEVAEALAVSPGTVKRDWRTARAWLFDEMRAPGPP